MQNEEYSTTNFIVSENEIIFLAFKSQAKIDYTKQIRLSKYILEEQDPTPTETSTEESSDEIELKPRIDSNLMSKCVLKANKVEFDI